MARSKSDVANMAIRIFLQKVGEHYDKIRGFDTFVGNEKQKTEVLAFFNNKCVFCVMPLARQNTDWDHLVPINKASLGLHSWGNVAPVCKPCHVKKHHKSWETFAGSAAVKKKITTFQKKYQYDPKAVLGEVTQTLYEDVGAVAMTLIELRFKQAQERLESLQLGG